MPKHLKMQVMPTRAQQSQAKTQEDVAWDFGKVPSRSTALSYETSEGGMTNDSDMASEGDITP